MLVGLTNKVVGSVGNLEVDTGKCPKNAATDAKLNAFQVMDLENRGRRNNIRLRGIPESVSPTNLKPTVELVLNSYLNRRSEDAIELDRVHRVAGGRSSKLGQPRDVLCRVHFFATKEAIMRAAWEKGPYQLEGA